jgi:CRISPR system Cascade subunit CasE
MSWLARITVDRDSAARLRLFDSYAWHRAAWAAFPGRNQQDRSFLSRLDLREGVFQLLLLSTTQPTRPSWCGGDNWRLVTLPAGFLEQSHYRFDLVANPTRKIVKLDQSGGPTKNGKRVALLRAEDQLAWLQRKAADGGFRLLHIPPIDIDRATASAFSIQSRKEHGMHFAVRFLGLLEVENRGAFQETFYRGVGSAKAFGYGMLVLKPVVNS